MIDKAGRRVGPGLGVDESDPPGQQSEPGWIVCPLLTAVLPPFSSTARQWSECPEWILRAADWVWHVIDT